MGMNKELEDLKKSLSQIKRDFFRQKISSEEFQKQKTELERKIKKLSSK